MAYPPISANDVVARGDSVFGNLAPTFQLKAGGAILGHRLVAINSSGDAIQGTSGSKAIIGCNQQETSVANGEMFTVGWGKQVCVAENAITAGDSIKCGDSGRALRFVDSTYAGASIGTSGVGSAFTNQPANDGVEILSSSAGDTTQVATVIGTTNGVDTVVVESKTLNGTTPVSTTKVDWGLILAVKLSAACVGTVTFREASGDLAITTIAPAALSKGVTTVSNGQAYNLAPSTTADGATTKQIGIQGTNAAGTVIYDSKASNGTTAANFATAFNTVTEIYTGDLEVARTVTIKTSATVDDPAKNIGRALASASAAGSLFGALLLPL